MSAFGPGSHLTVSPSHRPSVSRLRVLLIAEAANPEWVSVPLEGWSHSRAIARVADAHVATQVRNAEAFRRAGLTDADFTPIDSELAARAAWRLSGLLRGGSGTGWTTNTALEALAYPYFEWQVWKRFGGRIRRGEFDVVHRLTPLTPTAPSLLARRCRRAGVPFVLGPLNGGVPWPREFEGARRREREWLSYVRGAYRLVPGYRSTRAHAAAIIAGSRDTLAQIGERYRARCVYIPENAVDPSRFGEVPERPPPPPLRVAFVGRLVPYKGADMLLEAAAPLVRDGRVCVSVIGDGPEMPALRALVERERIGGGVELAGWVPHERLGERLGRSHVLGFPSVREFGGGVVLEAMMVGLVPVVLDYGGPGELVTPATGFALPMASREEIVRRLREVLDGLARDPSRLPGMASRARERVLRWFTWDAKAQQVMEVYRWVTDGGPKPDFGMPLPDGARDAGRSKTA